MVDIQGLIFRAVLHWSPTMALIVFGLGLLYMLQGFRFARALLALTCGGASFFLGTLAAGALGTLPMLSGSAVGLIGLLLALWRFRVGVLLASTYVISGITTYLVWRCGLPPNVVLCGTAVGALVGAFLFIACLRALPILLTTLQGAVLLVLGFTAVCNHVLPALSRTFVDWSESFWPTLPIMLTLFTITGYSVQANARQGDTRTGGGGGWNSLETN